MYNKKCQEGKNLTDRKEKNMEVMKTMTAKEILNLIEWLKSKNFTSDDIVDCIESIEGKKTEREE